MSTMKKIAMALGLTAMAIADADTQLLKPKFERPKDSKGNPIFPKSQLTKKQKRLRVKNRIARKSRKINRK